jgi:MSHA biogenesis protein MshQ
MGRASTFAGLALLALLAQVGPALGTTVAYYRFEEGTAGATAAGTGTILDSSGNGLNGTPVNGPVYSSNVPANPVPLTGATNTLSMAFNPVTGSRIFIPDGPQWQLSHSLTVEAYIYCTGAPNNIYDFGQIFFRGDTRSAEDPFFLAVTGNGTTATFQIEESAIVNAPIPLNKWVFLAATLNDATGKESIYVNDVLEDSITTSVRPAATLIAGDVPGEAIGSLQVDDGAQVFPGMIDEVRISDTALVPGQFLDDTPEPAPGCLALLATCAGLMIRWRRRSIAA